MRQDSPDEAHLSPGGWLRGEANNTSESEGRQSATPTTHASASNHDDKIAVRNASCIEASRDAAILCSSPNRRTDGHVHEIASNKVPHTKPSLRLNRFERHRGETGNMHLLMIGTKFNHQRNGELKFRTDFEACFKEFPLEHTYESHWTSRSPVSAQASVRSSSSASRDDHGKQSPWWPPQQSLEECEVYEFAKVKGLMNDVVLPRNVDGSPMAELDVPQPMVPPIDGPTTMNESLKSSTINRNFAIPRPRFASDRISKKLAALRPLSWAKRASVHIKHIRHSSDLTERSLKARLSSDSAEKSTSTPAWYLNTSGDGLLSHAGALDVAIEGGELDMPSNFGSPAVPVKLNINTALVLTSRSVNYECSSEGGSEDDADDSPAVEVVRVGACWMTIASHEQ